MRSNATVLPAALLSLFAAAGCSAPSSPALAPPAPPVEDAGPIAAGSCGAAISLGRAMVRTDRGVLRGADVGGVLAFKGIPYAAPPVGPLRFRPPEPAACWDDVREATTYGDACLQLDDAGKATGREDCLTLNVWAPENATAEPLPVLFFVHGGADIAGSTKDLWLGEPAFDGKELAERARAVVVTANYRLGALGFLTLPQLAAESPTHSSGNYGLRDLLASLHWVQSNARFFGGDPSRVVLFGQSAGAHNTCALVASPLATGLFSRAMMMSERCSVSAAQVVEAENATVAKATGCAGAADVSACLRAIPADKLTEAVPGSSGVGGSVSAESFYYSLNVDGDVLVESPIEAIASGRHNAVPFVIGTTAHETSMQIMNLPKRVETEADYRAIAHTLYGTALGDLALARYPAADYATPEAALITMTTDQRFTCTSRRIARAAAAGQTLPVRRYVFTYFTEHPKLRAYGAFHGIDVSFVFRTLRPFGDAPGPGDEAVSDRFIGYLSRFARTGDPNGELSVSWPLFDATSGGLLKIGAEMTVASDFAGSWCDFWDAHI